MCTISDDVNTVPELNVATVPIQVNICNGLGIVPVLFYV